MNKTEKNLMVAFAGESQANRKYLAFAKKAEKDGYKQVARLFRAAAAAETVHAHSHLKVYGGIKSTAENLQEAMKGEHYEFTSMYPEFLNDAKSEDHKMAIRSFDLAYKVEQVHYKLYEAAFKAVEKGKDLPQTAMFVCDVCGYTIEGEAPEICPICGAVHDRFMEIQ